MARCGATRSGLARQRTGTLRPSRSVPAPPGQVLVWDRVAVLAARGESTVLVRRVPPWFGPACPSRLVLAVHRVARFVSASRAQAVWVRSGVSPLASIRQRALRHRSRGLVLLVRVRRGTVWLAKAVSAGIGSSCRRSAWYRIVCRGRRGIASHGVASQGPVRQSRLG